MHWLPSGGRRCCPDTHGCAHEIFMCDCLQWRPLLGSSLLLTSVQSVRVNILGRLPWHEHLRVGETNDASMPKAGRVVASLTHSPAGCSTVNPISIIFVALAMSTDAFAAAIGKGASLHKPRLAEALRTGIIFGVIETITPLIGWFIGQAATSYVQDFDHWIAFVLLGALGLHMIYNGVKDEAPEEDKRQQHSFAILAVTAFATSIDALAVGVGLAFVNVNIWIAAAAIGVATTVMVTIGVMLGRVLGVVVGKRAEIIGGIVLMLVGAVILYEHLSAA